MALTNHCIELSIPVAPILALAHSWMQPTYISSVSFWGNLLAAAISAPAPAPAVVICLKTLICGGHRANLKLLH